MIGFAIRYSPLLVVALAWELVLRLGLGSRLALPPLGSVLGAWGELLGGGAAAAHARQPAGSDFLSDAEVGAHSPDADLVRLRRSVEGRADLPRLSPAGDRQHLQRRARGRGPAGLVGALARCQRARHRL